MTVPPTWCGVLYKEDSQTGEDMIFGLSGEEFKDAMIERDADSAAFLVAGAIFDLAYWGGDAARLADYVEAAMDEWPLLPFDRLEVLAISVRTDMPRDGFTREQIAEPLVAVLSSLFATSDDIIIVVGGPAWAVDICPN